MEFFLGWVSSLIISVIEKTGYAGVATLMALESANIPIPSEVIMPFSGFLAFQGEFNFLLVVFWGALGNLVGSLVSYYLGFFGGRRFFESYGKFLLISKQDVDFGTRLFQKYGTIIILASRVLPVVRTFISFPAGVARMNIVKFSLYTFAGSFIWSYFLAYVGVILGENWKYLEAYFRKFDWAIIALIILAGGWWVLRHVRKISNF